MQEKFLIPIWFNFPSVIVNSFINKIELSHNFKSLFESSSFSTLKIGKIGFSFKYEIDKFLWEKNREIFDNKFDIKNIFSEFFSFFSKIMFNGKFPIVSELLREKMWLNRNNIK